VVVYCMNPVAVKMTVEKLRERLIQMALVKFRARAALMKLKMI